MNSYFTNWLAFVILKNRAVDLPSFLAALPTAREAQPLQRKEVGAAAIIHRI